MASPFKQTFNEWVVFISSLVVLMTVPTFASNECRGFYHDPTDVHYALNFFKKFRNDYLPFGFKRLSRKKDQYDIYLLEKSYKNGSLDRPVEMGMVELLDKKGNVLDFETIVGVYEHVYGVNLAARNLLLRNDHQLDKVHTVRKRHTHPTHIGSPVIAEAFSDGDIRNDQNFRNEMNSVSRYKHIRLESWIAYLKIDLRVYAPEELENKDFGIRGYLVK